MLKISREDVKKAGLIDITTESFRDWLRIGCEEYFIEKNMLNAWGDISWFIGSRSDIIIELGEIYDVCPPRICKIWRNGLAILLKELPPKPQYIVIFEFLLNLAGHIRAYEILEVLPGTLGNGYFGYAENVAYSQNLFETALDIVAGMACGGDKNRIEEIILRLVESNYFPIEFSGFAFIALTRAYPPGLPEYAARMRGRIKSLYDQNPYLDLSELGWQVCDYIEVPIIGEMLNKLKINSYEQQGFDDKWLFSALFKGENAPLVIYKGSETTDEWKINRDTRMYIRQADNKLQIKEPLPRQLKQEIINELEKYLQKENQLSWDKVWAEKCRDLYKQDPDKQIHNDEASSIYRNMGFWAARLKPENAIWR